MFQDVNVNNKLVVLVKELEAKSQAVVVADGAVGVGSVVTVGALVALTLAARLTVGSVLLVVNSR
ncbi:unnamed protein product, partial [Medioppia subpectinata]